MNKLFAEFLTKSLSEFISTVGSHSRLYSDLRKCTMADLGSVISSHSIQCNVKSRVDCVEIMAVQRSSTTNLWCDTVLSVCMHWSLVIMSRLSIALSTNPTVTGSKGQVKPTLNIQDQRQWEDMEHKVYCIVPRLHQQRIPYLHQGQNNSSCDEVLEDSHWKKTAFIFPNIQHLVLGQEAQPRSFTLYPRFQHKLTRCFCGHLFADQFTGHVLSFMDQWSLAVAGPT